MDILRYLFDQIFHPYTILTAVWPPKFRLGDSVLVRSTDTIGSYHGPYVLVLVAKGKKHLLNLCDGGNDLGGRMMDEKDLRSA